ncbi:hypothetical protein [Caballeronia sp. S22]|uniref:hypothetical protein n=1 Tax=Caballeronia sp. S22 TaxID=3137182 RepID=UPI0035313289
MATRSKTSPTQAAPAPTVRFEATLGDVPRAKAVTVASALDLDRLPDAEGKVRLLLTVDDARRLLEQGFEVHLKSAIPVRPLAKGVVMSDAQADRWLEEQVKDLPRQGGR